jgi:hypothetical protein
MRARACARRLAISLLIVGIPVAAHSQADSGSDYHRNFPSPLAMASPERSSPEPTLARRFPQPPGAIGFQQIARAAGIIFSGTVTAISRLQAMGSQAPGTVAITFHVERGIRGATAGRDLTIFQWMGLWTSGQRYRVGERVLLFLYPPSTLGLTSCVGGTTGRFAVDAIGHVVLSQEHQAPFFADPALAGRPRLSIYDLAQAVRRAGEEK